MSQRRYFGRPAGAGRVPSTEPRSEPMTLIRRTHRIRALVRLAEKLDRCCVCDAAAGAPGKLAELARISLELGGHVYELRTCSAECAYTLGLWTAPLIHAVKSREARIVGIARLRRVGPPGRACRKVPFATADAAEREAAGIARLGKRRSTTYAIGPCGLCAGTVFHITWSLPNKKE